MERESLGRRHPRASWGQEPEDVRASGSEYDRGCSQPGGQPGQCVAQETALPFPEMPQEEGPLTPDSRVGHGEPSEQGCTQGLGTVRATTGTFRHG